MTNALPVALAPVAGFAARALARALRVDLGHPDRARDHHRPQLKGNGAATTGSEARFR
jgi:hypothetical protein